MKKNETLRQQAETFDNLIGLERRFIIDNQEGREADLPWHDGPFYGFEKCNLERVEPLLCLLQHGVLIAEARHVYCSPNYRGLSEIQFFVRNNAEGLDAFLHLCYQNTNLLVHTLKDGVPTAQSEEDDIILSCSYDRKGDLIPAITLDSDWPAWDGLSAIEETKFTLCAIIPKLSERDWSGTDEEFKSASSRADIFRVTAEYARKAGLGRKRRRDAAKRAADRIARFYMDRGNAPYNRKQPFEKCSTALQEAKVRDVSNRLRDLLGFPWPSGTQLEDLCWDIHLPPETASFRGTSDFQNNPSHKLFPNAIIIINFHQTQMHKSVVTDTTILGVLTAIQKHCAPLKLAPSLFKGLIPTDDKYVWGISTEDHPFQLNQDLMFKNVKPNIISAEPWNTPLSEVKKEWRETRDDPVILEIQDQEEEWLTNVRPFQIMYVLKHTDLILNQLQLRDRKIRSFVMKGLFRCNITLEGGDTNYESSHSSAG